MSFIVEPTARAQMDVRAALEGELGKRARLSPSWTAENAVKDHVAEYAERLTALLQTEYAPAPQELVWALKSRLGHRPLSIMPLRDRVIYRAMIESLADHLAPFDRRRVEYDAFERAPLDVPSTEYVVSADVAAFYQYVDHALLARRIIESAGRADLARSLAAFLGELFNRRFGLPQDNRASDVLGELYISPAERALARSGLAISRFNDDFRVATGSLDAGFEALERIQTELQAYGLTLNEEKSRVRRLNSYADGLGEVDRRTAEAQANQEVDLTQVDQYTGEPLEPSPEELAEEERERVRLAALTLFGESLNELRMHELDAVDRLTHRRLIATAINLVSAFADPNILSEGRRLLTTDPSLTPAWSRYLASLADAGFPDEAAAEALALLSPDGTAPAWQRWWLLQPYLSSKVTLDDNAANFLTAFADSSATASVRARAVLVLAFHDRLDAGQVAEHFQAAPPAARADLAAATGFARAAGGSALQSVRGDSPEANWIVARADADSSDTSWL